MPDFLIRLYPRPDDLLHDVRWADPSVGCATCHSLRPGDHPVDVVVRDPPEVPLIPCNPVDRWLARRELLADLGPAVVASDLLPGRVFRSDGTELVDYASVRARHVLLTRSATEWFHRLCPACGRLITGGQHAPYFTRRALAAGSAAYEDEDGGPVVTEEAYRLLASKWGRCLRGFKVRVLDRPVDDDDLPEGFDIYPTPGQLVTYRPHWPNREPVWMQWKREREARGRGVGGDAPEER
jgi:hypothetical protein